MENPFKGRKANKKFDRTSKLIPKIGLAGKQILVEILPFSKVPRSKLILPKKLEGDYNSFARAIIITKGEECTRKYLKSGDEIYFGSNVSQPINYPNPDESDKMYVILSEENVIYYIKR
jgi:hypothetical protein